VKFLSGETKRGRQEDEASKFARATDSEKEKDRKSRRGVGGVKIGEGGGEGMRQR